MRRPGHRRLVSRRAGPAQQGTAGGPPWGWGRPHPPGCPTQVQRCSLPSGPLVTGPVFQGQSLVWPPFVDSPQAEDRECRLCLKPQGPPSRQASGHRTRRGSSRLQSGPWPPALALGCLSPRAGSRSWRGDRPEALPGQAPATCPLGTRGGRVGEPLGLSFPDCTVREAVVLLLIQTRPLTGVQGRLLVSSQTDPGLWAAGGHPCCLEGPSLLLKWTWAQISAWVPSDRELKSSAV